MADSKQLADTAQQLLAGRLQCFVASQSLEHPGYPFGSVVPYCLDQAGIPLLLLSHLSQHTKNLIADPRCTFTILESGNGDVQQQSRLSAIADCHSVASENSAAIERYFRYFPQTRSYYEQLNFRFFQLHPHRFHFNAGFATARWFGVNRIIVKNPLSPEVETALLHTLRQDHLSKLRDALYKTNITRDIPTDLVIVGLDTWGIDLRLADRLLRLRFTQPISEPQDIPTLISRLAE